MRPIGSAAAKMPFPVFGKDVGDFPLYDALLAGCASRAVQGERIESDTIPSPDEEIRTKVRELRAQGVLNAQETEFLAYVDLMEQMRAVLLGG
jgi:hypothetical protein